MGRTAVGPLEISRGGAGGGSTGFAEAVPPCCPPVSGAQMGAAPDPVESCRLVLTSGEPDVPSEEAPVSGGAGATVALGGGVGVAAVLGGGAGVTVELGGGADEQIAQDLQRGNQE
ncbi:hypothetical protein [Saccharopolyspora hattusasensis]|uniref:hypothetical protein n=1 Tax=Saccharopolyspora hattusasensis TaxID=1128679 RepID=UPI003D96AA42